jgi:UDP-2,3-diacylglucosamine pyrophosphatase LpxH
MIVVLSDLHFSEAESTQIGPYRFNRNLPPEPFRAYFAEINQIAIANELESVDFVLAGDILEISRSGLWLEGDLRPYMNNQEILTGSKAEAMILRILNAIASEGQVRETLGLFRDIQSSFDVNVNLHYLLGNHDRLVNATPAIRQKVRDMFGLPGGESLFEHSLIIPDALGQPFCLVRHGHEYDPVNFSLNVKEMEVIPTKIDEEIYGNAPLGDITTIEFGAALPRVFIEEYGEEKILGDETLMALYRRLMAFDDVRPTTALLAYLFSTPNVKKRKTWDLMKPCFVRIISDLRKNERLQEEIHDLTSLSKSRKLLLTGIMNSTLLRRGLPYWMVKQLMKRVSKKIKLKSPVKWVKKEALIQDRDSGCQCVISGHTHFPEVSLISAKKGDERYYINTGTWRNILPATSNFKQFGRLKALSKVMVFKPHEKYGGNGHRSWSFHFQSGLSFGNHRHI